MSEYILQTDVPRCPQDATLMFIAARSSDHTYYVCPYCKQPYMIVGTHKSDKEVIISDNALSGE